MHYHWGFSPWLPNNLIAPSRQAQRCRQSAYGVVTAAAVGSDSPVGHQHAVDGRPFGFGNGVERVPVAVANHHLD